MQDQSNYPKFDDLKITTMTLVVFFKGSIDLYAAFLLTMRENYLCNKTKKSDIELPHLYPGAILSNRYFGAYDGPKTSCFKNSIIMDISLKEKNVNLKLSKSKIQICGATSAKEGEEVAQYLFEKLEIMEREVKYMNEHKEEKQKTIDWLIENTKGSPYILNYQWDYTLKVPTDNSPNSRIASFLSSRISKFWSYLDYRTFLEWIRNLKEMISCPLQVEKICKAMVNYNYNLGFKINKKELATKFLNVDGFSVPYSNMVHHYVTIELPYENYNPNILRKKDKRPCHKFFIYNSGKVTQTGPDEGSMREAYYRFIKPIYELRSYIDSKSP